MTKLKDLWKVQDTWNGWNYIRAADAASAAADVQRIRLDEAKRVAKELDEDDTEDIDWPVVREVVFVTSADKCL